MSLKLTFGMIVLNGDFFLRQVLESIYPFAHKICIAEGPVKYWRDQGVMYSTDDTLYILRSFPDPQNKIVIESRGYLEKDDQCRAWFDRVPQDTDYVFCVDSDEVHRREDIEKLIAYLEKEKPVTVGFKSDTFYGGFDRVIGGFERDHSFKRVLKFEPGCHYLTHRQPTLANKKGIPIDQSGLNITGNQLYQATGITMPHYSYVSPKGVYEKLKYYESAVISKGNCIPNYFKDVFVPWVTFNQTGNYLKREWKEKEWKGVQEFIPSKRGEAYTIPFTGEHPDVIKRDMNELVAKFNRQLKQYENL